MIYTCYEMIEDCRAGKPQGWSYLLAHYVPVIRKVLAHYYPDREQEAFAERVILTLHGSGAALFESTGPSPERPFVAALRQHVLAAAEIDRPSASAEIEISLEDLSVALEPLTTAEKEAVWFEAMRYEAADGGRMLRMDPKTVEKIRNRGAELIRGKLDAWRRSVLAENGVPLGRTAAAARGAECYPAKLFFDIIDGRCTWRVREEADRHIRACWHCIDHFCRLLEVVDLLRGSTPLSDPELGKYRTLLALPDEKPSRWKRMFAR